MKKTTLQSGIEGMVSNAVYYETEKGIISMLTPCQATMNRFQIYSIKGRLFTYIERYESLEEVEERINELLNE